MRTASRSERASPLNVASMMWCTLRPRTSSTCKVMPADVANDDTAAGILRELAQAGVCEVGAHVHNWTSPPFTDDDVRRRTYHTDIDRDLEKQKIADVTHLIEEDVRLAHEPHPALRVIDGTVTYNGGSRQLDLF